MRSRSLYHFILRLHPACFRGKYEDQMMWIFDESVASRGALSLLFDALVSLLRQWVLRSGYRRHAQPQIPVDGTNVLAELLRRKAWNMHRRAWRVNLFWLVGALVLCLTFPIRLIANPFLTFMLINSIVMYSRSKQGGRGAISEHAALSWLRYNRSAYRTLIERKRDGLLAWCRFKPSKKAQPYGGGFCLITLAFLAV